MFAHGDSAARPSFLASPWTAGEKLEAWPDEAPGEPFFVVHVLCSTCPSGAWDLWSLNVYLQMEVDRWLYGGAWTLMPRHRRVVVHLRDLQPTKATDDVESSEHLQHECTST